MAESVEEPPLPPELTYMYAHGGGAALGPVTLAQLRVLWISGHIDKTTTLWRDGLPGWTTLAALDEVAGPLSSLTQPPPSKLWFYMDASNKQRGGVTNEQVGMLLKRGEVDGMTHFWRHGEAAWLELGKIDELREVLLRSGDDDEDEEEAEAAAEAARKAMNDVAYDPEAEAFVPRALAAAPGGSAAATATATAAAAAAAAVTVVPAADGDAAAAAAKPKRVRKKKKPAFKASSGSNVYVSNLPVDATVEEVAEAFKVAGVVKVDPVSGAPRIKFYLDASGRPKGDGLVSFLKEESVKLAVTLRDGYEMRDGCRLSVRPAVFEAHGELKPNAARPAAGKEEAARRKKQRALEQKQLASWEDGLSSGFRAVTVVLTGLFSGEGDEGGEAHDEDFYANLRQDVQVECAKAGAVEKVTVFEGSERGAVAVRFKDPDSAERCAAMMNERQFGAQKVACELYDGVTDYRSKAAIARAQGGGGGGADAGDGAAAASAEDGDLEGGRETLEQQEKKLEEFGDWLEDGSSTDEEMTLEAD